MTNRIARGFTLVLLVALAAGCVSMGRETSSRVPRFWENLSEFDVVPPSWITSDGRSDGSYPDGANKATAYVFPSLPFAGPARQPVNVDIPDFFRPDNNWFHDGIFVQSPGSELEKGIGIRSAKKGTHLTIDVDADSVAQILRLDWREFRKLQGAYLSWLHGQSTCWWPLHCFSTGFNSKLRDFWKANVLKEATFAIFAQDFLNKANRPVTIQYKDSAPMFATLIHPGQQLFVTWGNQNFNAAFPLGGNAATVNTSYSRVTPGGITRIEVVSDRGVRLYPAQDCGMRGLKGSDPAPPPNVLLPYPAGFNALFGTWFIPIFGLFDLHDPRLLFGKGAAESDPPRCPDETRPAPKYLFLLAPAYYVKPDTFDRVTQFETEGRLGSTVDAEGHLVLTRQFAILACDYSDSATIEDEWNRLLDAAAGSPRGRGRCGDYVHGVFSGKTFVQLRNHFSVDGRLVEDGALSLATIGQVSSPSLGTRMNLEATPGSRPLLEVWRVAPWKHETDGTRRLHIRFYTTMSNVLDQAALFEGDDLHAIPISEVLR